MISTKKFNSRKGQILTVGIVIAITAALIASYFLISYVYSPVSPLDYLGAYESSIVSTIGDGDKVLLYTDVASHLAATSAILDFVSNGGTMPAPNENSLGTTLPNYCGEYIYNLWDTKTQDCFPSYNNLDFYMSKHLAAYTYLSNLNNGAPGSSYFSSVFSKNINYQYMYTPSASGTTITGYTTDVYTLSIFSDPSARDNPAVQHYVSQTTQVSSSADIPGVPFISAASTNYMHMTGKTNKYVVIHYTAGATLDSAVRTFEDPAREASANYVVGSTIDNYKVVQMVRDSDKSYNAGCTSPKYGCSKEAYKRINSESIGIEIVNEGYATDISAKTCPNNADFAEHVYARTGEDYCWQIYPEAQYQKVAELVALLAQKYNIPVDRQHIIGHEEVVQKGKYDPGPAFDWNKFMGYINSDMKLSEDVLVSEIAPSQQNALCLASGSSDAASASTNTDWKISNMKLSSTSLTSDQTLSITLTIENAGQSCVNVAPDVIVSRHGEIFSQADGLALSGDYELKAPAVGVYQESSEQPYTNINTVTCTFTTDSAAAASAKSGGRCLLYVPPDGSSISYDVAPQVIDENNHYAYDTVLEKTITVKAATSQQNSNSNTNTQSSALSSTSTGTSTISLTKAEQSRIQTTRQRLNFLGIIDFITQTTQQYGVPTPIVLGLISQESTGNMHAGSTASAIGLMQMTPKTYASLNFPNKCSWSDYPNNAQCQVLSGVYYLKQLYNGINSKTLYYSCSLHCAIGSGSSLKYVPCSACSTSNPNACIGPVNTVYTGWDAALREYNGGGWTIQGKTDGLGCGGLPDYQYVDKVMRLAIGWGYSSSGNYAPGSGYVTSYSTVIANEINNGLWGTYKLTPIFNTQVDFNLGIIDDLKSFASSAISDCGSADDKNACVQGHIDSFNLNFAKKYPDLSISSGLSMHCDSADQAAVNSFAESIMDCVNSNDTSCECLLNESYPSSLYAKSGMDATTFEYNLPSGLKQDVPISASIVSLPSQSGQMSYPYWSNGAASVKYVRIYKSSQGLVEIEDSQPNPKDGTIKTIYGVSYDTSSPKYCVPNKNTFKLCLNTGYLAQQYAPGSPPYVPVVVRFAIMVRDKTPPPMIENISLYNENYSKNSVTVTWSKSPASDVADYIVYMGSSSYDFKTQTSNMKSNIPYRTLGALEPQYDTYNSINYTSPQCNMQDSTGYSYCNFVYNATDKFGKPVQITLEQDKLYYLNNTNTFVYILNGSDPYNTLNSGERYIGVTAIDADNNEIDGLSANQTFETSKNLAVITPKDLRVPALTKITSSQVSSDGNSLVVSWNALQNYIDGIGIAEGNVGYNLYLSSSTCSAGLVNLRDLGQPVAQYDKADGNGFDTSSMSPGDYCMAVSAYLGSGLTYPEAYAVPVTIPERK